MNGLSIYGLPVIVSSLLPMDVANKPLPYKRWHKSAKGYAKRVAKKWRRRYGTHQVSMLMAGGNVMLSAKQFAVLRDQIKGQAR